MCTAVEFRKLIYSGLKQTGVAVVFIAAWAWQSYNNDKRNEKMNEKCMQVIAEQSSFMAEQTEVIRNQTRVLEQLAAKIEGIIK